MDLREKIIGAVIERGDYRGAARAVPSRTQAAATADAILAIPEIAEGLAVAGEFKLMALVGDGLNCAIYGLENVSVICSPDTPAKHIDEAVAPRAQSNS